MSPPARPSASRSNRPSAAIAKLHRRISAALEAAAGRPAATGSAHAQNEPITFYGVPKAAWRGLHEQWRQPFSELGIEDRLALARLLLRSHIEEEGHVALAALRAGIADLTPSTFDELDRLLDDFSSWSMTDDFASGKPAITLYLLQRYPKETLAVLARWNRSQNRWKRRASVITFTRAVAASGEFVDVTLRFCEALQHDPDDLVRKAAGWALKDTMRAGPGAKRRVAALVKEMRRAGVSSTITLYAIRDLKGAEREAILKVKSTR